MRLRFLRQLTGDDAGAVIIELAIAAPVLALLVMGVGDIATAYTRKLELEQAAQRAIEKVMQTTGDETPEDAIKKEAVCQINGTNADNTCKEGRLTTDNVVVTYRLECNGAVMTNYNADCDPGQTEVRYMMATVTDTYSPIFGKYWGGNDDGLYHLQATAGVRVG
jgi:Flp pilus assembly protein TadG